MKLYGVTDSLDDKFAGIYTNPKVAKIVHEIFSLVVDEQSEIVDVESDPYAEQLLAGKKPWEICVEYYMSTGKVRETDVHPIWPPEKEEGLLENREGFRRYFFWAETKGKAISRLGSVKVPPMPHETELARMRERLSEQATDEEEEAY